MARLLRSVIALFALLCSLAQAQTPLSEEAFRVAGAANGTVILQTNWGRYWKCGTHENAQLQRLAFRLLGDRAGARQEADWDLSPSSHLLAKPSFVPYAVLLPPGEYALSNFKIKVADSVSDVAVADVGPSKLIVDGAPVGGSFSVAAGEVVYVGHFGVDCNGEPTPWRFYIDGRRDFEAYVAGFKKQFPFMKDIEVTFRLFKTEKLGVHYDLPK